MGQFHIFSHKYKYKKKYKYKYKWEMRAPLSPSTSIIISNYVIDHKAFIFWPKTRMLCYEVGYIYFIYKKGSDIEYRYEDKDVDI